MEATINDFTTKAGGPKRQHWELKAGTLMALRRCRLLLIH